MEHRKSKRSEHALPRYYRIDREPKLATEMRQYAIDIEKGAADALTALGDFGLFLLSDKNLPSLVTMIIGVPVRGSWWAHPLCHEIYMVSQRLRNHRDVAVLKLVSGKTTFVHRSRWSALYALANAADTWQTVGLAASATELLAKVRDLGILKMDEVGGRRSKKELGEDARLLESRLLVFGDDVHTDSGAHVKRIETWNHWCTRVSLAPDRRISSSNGRASFDSLAEAWRRQFETVVSLPWHQGQKRRR